MTLRQLTVQFAAVSALIAASACEQGSEQTHEAPGAQQQTAQRETTPTAGQTPAESPGRQQARQAADIEPFPYTWFYQSAGRLKPLEGQPAPELNLTKWIGDPVTIAGENQKGKIVVLDFWGTWCGPCRAAIPKNVQLADKYREHVTFLGVHDPKRGWQRMGQVAESSGINYPLAIDAGGSVQKYRVSFWPTYVIIDRNGTIRGAGLQPNAIELAIKALLAESGVNT